MSDTYSDLVFGYSVVWGLIVIYVFLLGRRLGRVEAALRDAPPLCDDSDDRTPRGS